MKQKLLLLLTLLCTMTGSAWAEDEVLLSYQMDNENYAAQTELAAGNGTIYFGADKREESDFAACGYGYKLDGDMSETSIKYVLLNLSRALAAGDVIKIKMYSSSTPSGSDYGISIFAERATVDPLATLYLSGKKNEEKEMTYTVKENDGIAGLSSIYLARAAGKSTYLTAVEVGAFNTEDPTGEELTDGKTWDFTVTSTTDWDNLLADETNWTKASEARMSNKNSYANAPLIANGQELEATKGLLFNISAADKLRIDKNNRLCLNGSGLSFTIPGLSKGQKVTITARTASKSGLDRYLSAENLTVTEGEGFAPHDADEWFANVGTVTKDGDVIIKTNVGGMNIQKIVVTASEGGGEPTVVIAKPTFEVDGVTYESGATVEGLKTGQRVTINVEEGMYIYTNWSGKTGGSKETYYVAERMKGQTSYGAMTSSGGQRVLYAVAGDTDDASGNSSDLAYIVFTGVTPADPVFTPAGGDVDAGTVVTIETSNKEDKIYYTTDGTEPTSESTLYTEAGITVDETTTINAIAYDKNDANPSAVVTETYTVAAVVAPAAPVFSTPDYQGDINNITRENINVYIEVEEGCSVKYTTDGSDPATSETARTLSATAISIGRNYVTLIETCTLKAVAVKDGVASEVTEETYTFVAPQEETISVEITDAGYATVYYAQKALVVPTGVEAFIVTEDDIINEFENWGFVANYAATETIPAGEAVILKGEPGTYEFTVDPTNSDWANWDNMLRGYDPDYDLSAMTTGPGNDSYKFYLLSTRENEVGLYYGAADGAAFECAPNKAYLAVPVSLANNTKSFIFDHTTGIDAVQNASTSDAAIYNLQGVRMNTQKLNRGIYIMNGKKVVIK